MRHFTKALSVILSLSLVFSLLTLSGCKNDDVTDNGKKQTSTPVSASDIKIGVLTPCDSSGNTPFVYQKNGLEAAAKKLDIDANGIIYEYSVTDITFSADEKFSVSLSSSETESASKSTSESTSESATADESQTEKTVSTTAKTDNKSETEPVTVATPTYDTALEAADKLVSGGCNVIISSDPIYAEFTKYLAGQLPKVFFLQRGSFDSELDNLMTYSDNLYEGLYLVGVAAGIVSEIKFAGFVAPVIDDTVKSYVNAFANGMRSTASAAVVRLASTNVPLDLVLEKTLVDELVASRCDVIAQSVMTALPIVAAEEAKVPCFGFGYDMSADSPTYHVASVECDWSIMFEKLLSDLIGGTFTKEHYTANLENGSVRLTDITSSDSTVATKVAQAKGKIISGEIDPLADIAEGTGYATNVEIFVRGAETE